MMNIQTNELIGSALNWAVAACEEYPMSIWYDENQMPITRDDEPAEWAPSTNWAQGGPIIERERAALWPDEEGGFFASADEGAGKDFHGPTPLIAAMRAYVASCMGDTVDVPDELAPRDA